MSAHESLLQESQEKLSEIVKPYQQESNRRQKMVEAILQCIHGAEREDFFQLDELLRSKTAEKLLEDPELQKCDPIFKQLLNYADEKVDQYRIEFIEKLKTLAQESELPIEVDFPRFYVLKGIEGEIDFPGRVTTINKKELKSIDPKKIVSAALKYKRQLYDRPFDPQEFIDSLYSSYTLTLKNAGMNVGELVPIRTFYREHVLLMQSNLFFQNMDKGKFKGYSLEQFSIDLWCYFQANTGGTSDGYSLALRPGRNNSLWLIDPDGEKRQITSLSFNKSSE
ncbi:hypothetical protein WDW89_19940 [Deltaproteobacteria bacterium TL4]